jgi:hypothetical protein
VADDETRPAVPVATTGPGLGWGDQGYGVVMLYTIFIILAIIALALFILGRR